ncbi:MAG: hypothetical protein OXB96_01580 [Candidatus Kaiserbacteria bacterium]|nr:hypothetical protein [Candidatus Kaiserbacteria bacterium]
MRISLLFLFHSIFLTGFLMISGVVFAQGEYDAYDMVISESYPSPGEYVDFTITSNKSFVSSIQSVAWYIDGVEQVAYANKTKITEIAGGVPKRINAQIRYFNSRGERKATSIAQWIRPAIFDILWEADSVVTPLYRGHRLAGPQTPITFSAKIQYIDQNGVVYTEKDFSFRWMIESRYHDDRGPGMSSVIYEKGGSYLNKYIIVQAETTLISNGEVSFEKVINVPIIEPRLLVYPHTLLYGLSRDRVVSQNLSLGSEEVTASVYPFYFSQSDFTKNAIQYKWFVNNQTSHLKEGRKLDISIQGGGTDIPVRVFAQNENKDLQQSTIQLTFRL